MSDKFPPPSRYGVLGLHRRAKLSAALIWKKQRQAAELEYERYWSKAILRMRDARSDRRRLVRALREVVCAVAAFDGTRSPIAGPLRLELAGQWTPACCVANDLFEARPSRDPRARIQWERRVLAFFAATLRMLDVRLASLPSIRPSGKRGPAEDIVRAMIVERGNDAGLTNPQVHRRLLGRRWGHSAAATARAGQRLRQKQRGRHPRPARSVPIIDFTRPGLPPEALARQTAKHIRWSWDDYLHHWAAVRPDAVIGRYQGSTEPHLVYRPSSETPLVELIHGGQKRRQRRRRRPKRKPRTTLRTT